jgi:N-carbamoyl-L-amino-acid hydrolase
MTVDLRDLDETKVEHFSTRFEQIAREIGEATKTKFSFARTVDSVPAISDPRVMSWIDSAAQSLGLTRQRMPSGAGHDAQEIAHIAPMAMIFIPSIGGISHSPREFSRPEDIANGANVLLNAVVNADTQ